MLTEEKVKKIRSKADQLHSLSKEAKSMEKMLRKMADAADKLYQQRSNEQEGDTNEKVHGNIRSPR